MIVVYIAGRYRGGTAWEVRQNIEAVAASVWAAGGVALCPHLNSAHMEGVASDEHFLAGTMELMERCDAIIMCAGWDSSQGSKAEHARAVERGIPIMYEGSGRVQGFVDAVAWRKELCR